MKMKMKIKTKQDFDELSQYEYENSDAIAKMGKQLRLPSTAVFVGEGYMVMIDYWADDYFVNTVKLWVYNAENGEEYKAAERDLLERDVLFAEESLDEFMHWVSKAGRGGWIG